MATADTTNPNESLPATEGLEKLLQQRILVLDGAMGTMVQALGLDESDVRGERFREHHKSLRNFVDLLCLTQPDLITEIHRQYLDAGADIIETNTFGSSPIALGDFDLEHLAREFNLAAVDCAGGGPGGDGAGSAAASFRRRFDRPDQQDRFDFASGRRSGIPRGHVRPIGRFLLPPDRRAGRRRRRHAVSRNDVRHAEPEGLPVRHRPATSTNTGLRLPVMASVTITDASGRTLVRPDGRGVLELDLAFPTC